MYINRKLALPLVLSLFFVFLLGIVSLSAQEMTMEEYQQQLQEYTDREVKAKAEIAQLELDIKALNEELAKVEEETNNTWQEIWAMLGTDEAGVNEYRASLEALESEINGLLSLSPDELFQRKKEIDDLEAKLNEYKKSKISALTEMQDKIDAIERKLARLRQTLKDATPYDLYTVIKGDYLWKISKKETIYGDPYQWIRIYTYNRDQIKNPDLIFPEQVFKIQQQFADNEYLVVKGDFLKKIAESQLGDPKKWTEIYEANKTVIGEDKMLYPYQVLLIPGK
ncbi:LysM peptidoglycan-binding domain-containing protein [candidate division KSB1 bacterium]|nr:LysM peptidoglycan-binding domain-containing protein [candidate division KSB1 bacterium]